MHLIPKKACFIFLGLIYYNHGKEVGHDDIKYVQNPDVNEKTSRPNILFLISDDLRPMLGSYEDYHPGFESPRMYTPNLDKLSKRSMLFERTYAQLALCSPSRSSMLTSRRPDTTRVTDLDTYWRTYGGNYTTIPQFFKENGYHTVGFGKVFHPGDASGEDDPMSWSEPYYHAPDYYPPGSGLSWRALTQEQMMEKPPEDEAETGYALDKLQELAIKNKEDETPFFLALGIHRPHLPFLFPEEFLSLYPEEDINEPSNPFVPSDMPTKAWSDFGELRNYEDCTSEVLGIPDLGNINVTLPSWKKKELRRAYYSAVSYADYCIGRLLTKLEELDLADNTIVVFWGDHGWQLGEHAEWCKQTNFEIATHVPLMFKIPGLTYKGLLSNRLTELVDVFPTLVEAAGFEPLNVCPQDSNSEMLCTEGDSLIPLIRDPEETSWKEAVFWQYPRGGSIMVHRIPTCMGYSIRTDTYRYTEWVKIKELDGEDYEPAWESPCDCEGEPCGGELYDLSNDPLENVNIANDEMNEELILELSKRLRDGWRYE